MRVFLLALCFAVLAGCSGSGGYIRPLADGVPRTIYVDKAESDSSLNNVVDMALLRAGFDPVNDISRANYRLRLAFDWNIYNMTALVRITEIKSGDTYYFGEGKNNGFGTAIKKSAAMAGCVERALDNLR